MNRLCAVLTWVFALAAFSQPSLAADEQLTADQKSKLEARFLAAEALVKDKDILASVQHLNSAADPAAAAMTQDKWKAASVLDPFVRSLTKNAAAAALKKAQAADPALSEGFLSAADGTKAAFISKPSSWSHKGKPKHDTPLAGNRWTGAVEVDDSSGLKQIQIAVPVLDNGKPVGALVLGFQLSKL